MAEEQRPVRPGSQRARRTTGSVGGQRPSGRAGAQRPSGRAGAQRPSGGKDLTRKCAKCGAEVPFGTRRCPECDAPVGRQRKAFRGKRGGCLRTIFIVVVAAVVLGGAFLGVLFVKPALVPGAIRNALRGLGLPVPEVTESAEAEEGAEEVPEEAPEEEGEAESEGPAETE